MTDIPFIEQLGDALEAAVSHDTSRSWRARRRRSKFGGSRRGLMIALVGVALLAGAAELDDAAWLKPATCRRSCRVLFLNLGNPHQVAGPWTRCRRPGRRALSDRDLPRVLSRERSHGTQRVDARDGRLSGRHEHRGGLRRRWPRRTVPPTG